MEHLSDRFQNTIACSEVPGEGLRVKWLLQNPPALGSCLGCIKGLFHSKNLRGK